MKGNLRNQGFTLIELLVVITIIAILASLAMPAYTKIQESAKITKDVSNARQIILSCNSFASDYDGLFPSFDPESEGDDSSFSTSTDAFNVLIPDYVDQESIFYTAGNPDKPRAPSENSELEQSENSYVYVSGQTNTTFSRSPLVADEMESPGTYGENHPWLKSKKAVVGYCGGNVAAEFLTDSQPGATVRTKDNRIKDIFMKRSGDDEGGSSGGGLLATDTSNILLP